MPCDGILTRPSACKALENLNMICRSHVLQGSYIDVRLREHSVKLMLRRPTQSSRIHILMLGPCVWSLDLDMLHTMPEPQLEPVYRLFMRQWILVAERQLFLALDCCRRLTGVEMAAASELESIVRAMQIHL